MDLESKGLLEQIHADALRVLEEVGVKCVSKEVRRIFEDTGLAAFDESTGHIHVLSPLIEQVLTTLQKETGIGYRKILSAWVEPPRSYTMTKPGNWWSRPLSMWPASQALWRKRTWSNSWPGGS